MSFALTSLSLSHFRSHLLSRMEMDGRPVALWGRNGAGKTNILEAASLFSPGRGMRRAGAAEMARRPEALGWKLTGHLEGHEVETWSEGGAARLVRVDGKLAPQAALGRMGAVLWLVPSMDRLWTEGAEGRRRFLDRAVLSFDPGHGEAVLSYDKAMRERNRLLKDQVRDGRWYEALEAQMAEAGQRIHAARLAAIAALEAAQRAAQTVFPAATLRLVQSEGEMPDDLASALAAGRGRDMAAGRSLIGPHRSDLEAHWAVKGIAARDCSTGEQKALLVSLILANARALPRPPLLLLDEVAAHLDATRRDALYDEICALGAQAWMTGTGPELFADLGTRAQHFELCDEDGISRVVSRTVAHKI